MTGNTPAIDLNWRRNSYLFLFSQFATGITSMIVQYAIIWYLTQKSGSATILSMATLLAMLPMILVSPFVGTFIDRWNKKALLIVPDVVAAAFAIVLSVAGTLNSTFPLWLVFVSLLARSFAQAFQMPTIQSILPTIVPQEEVTKVNGQLGMIQSATMIISPALGALLYSFIPINYLILIDVLGAMVGIGMLAFIAIPSNFAQTDEKPKVFADMVFAFKRIGTVRGLWPMLLISSLFTLMFMPAGSLYPLMTLGYFKGTIFQAGIVEVVWSAGSLLGGALIGAFGAWKDRMRPIIIAIAAFGLAFALCGFLPPNITGFVIFTVLNAFAGLAIAFPSALPMAMMQQSFPAQELGRIFGVVMAFSNLAGPAGLLFAGPVADAVGVQWLFTISGIGSIFSAALMFAVPSARLYDRHLQQRLQQDPEAAPNVETVP
jgi:DHA3 family macrolide efflux protein-like MFS transporter